jgi:hypothetical protein
MPTIPKGERRPADVIGNAVRGCFVFSLAQTSAALSQDVPPSQKVMHAAQVVRLCYNAGAIKYALQTCEPPASIIIAVYGRCDDLERDFRHVVELENRNNRLLSEEALNTIRKGVVPQLYDLILDTRASSGNKCP